MAERRYKHLSLRGPVTLFIIVLVLTVTLTVLWNVVLVHDYNTMRDLAAQSEAFHWTFIALGSSLFITIIVLSSILGAQLIAQIRWSQRQSNFVASVSHELNSPLSAIKLFAQTLRRSDLSAADRRNFVEKILFDVERLSRLISNILRAAEVDLQGDELQVLPQDVELSDYLRSYISDAAALGHAKKLEIRLEDAADLPEVHVRLDPMMFRQVLDNLVDNAIRYHGEAPPRIHIRMELREESVQLQLQDQGIGIAASELPRLFDRFYRIDPPTPEAKRKGTGIGLFIVRSIVRAHGGNVWAESHGPGRGTTMNITLPLLGEAAAHPADSPSSERAVRAS